MKTRLVAALFISILFSQSFANYFDKPLTEFRAIDGYGNNINHPEWGSSNQAFIRKAPSAYTDSLNTPAGETRPSARKISYDIFTQIESHPNPQGASNFLWLWGQFVDHDIDLTAGPNEGEEELFNIPVPTGDMYFDPNSDGDKWIMLTRSGFASGTGVSGIPRQQVNLITAFLDASMVYGSDPSRNQYLRKEGGKLKMTGDSLLPLNDGSQPNAGGNSTDLYVAGDVRANENMALTSLHNLFVREHNRLVDEIKNNHPDWNDEMLYQHAKAIIEGQVQAITFNEFLPQLLGQHAFKKQMEYRKNVNPQISNLFATAAYRLGHTLLDNMLYRFEKNGDEYEHGNMPLQYAFFNPEEYAVTNNLEAVFRGMAGSHAEAMDTKMVTSVQNFLFGQPGSGGFDLASLNIQRGRDHGLGDYNSVREIYHLKKFTNFSQITDDFELQQQLENLYSTPDNIDLFVGGLAEKTVKKSMLGQLFKKILKEQFSRIRSGDRFWYSQRLPKKLVKKINRIRLSDIIKRNSHITHLQPNIFQAYKRMGGDEFDNDVVGSDHKDLIIGFGGNDNLFGGEGHDCFSFAPNSGHDIIHNWEQGDRIDISAYKKTPKEIRIIRKRHQVKIVLDSQNSITVLTTIFNKNAIRY